MNDTPLIMLLVAAHPDDETIGAGALLAGAQTPPQIIHLTNGAPRNGDDAQRYGFPNVSAYARARRLELENAMAEAKIPSEQLVSLDIPDQELTYHLVHAIQKLVRLLIHFAPNLILTHPYEGGHPDHDATAFIVHTAVALRKYSETLAPTIIEFSSYHAGPGGILRTGCFLPYPGYQEQTRLLTPEQQKLKKLMLGHFKSQKEVLNIFGVTHEIFRPAPVYDFSKPPHSGPLYYETGFNSGISGRLWRSQAARTQQALKLSQKCDSQSLT